MDQLSFFTSALDIFEEGVAYLHRLELELAETKITEAVEIDPALTNAEFYLEVIRRCGEWGLRNGAPPQYLFAARREIFEQQRALGGTSPLFTEILKIITRNVQRNDELFTIDGSVADCQPFLHEAECVLRAGQYQPAYLMLLDLVEKSGADLPARYWGYLGDAAIAYNRRSRADTAYLHLLALAPQEVDWSTFKHQRMRDLFVETARNNPSGAALYPLWAFNLWLHDALVVPEGFPLPLRLLIARENESIDSMAEHERLQLFFLYVLKEEASIDASPDTAGRRQMQALAPQLFELFLRKKAGETV